MDYSEIKAILDHHAAGFESNEFIANDPISVPHLFSRKEDIEIASLFSAILAWGQRPVIIRNANDLMQRMDMAPYDFVINHDPSDLKRFHDFKHRTFQYADFKGIILGLKELYKSRNGLEGLFSNVSLSIPERIASLQEFVLNHDAPKRTSKHLPNPITKIAPLLQDLNFLKPMK
jgi:uncharacterized protein (TIGR02757 family)